VSLSSFRPYIMNKKSRDGRTTTMDGEAKSRNYSADSSPDYILLNLNLEKLFNGILIKNIKF